MILSRRTFGWGLAAAFAMAAAPALARDPDDWPNVFIAPMGKPYRAPMGAPYPVVDWFKAADKNADGKLDHAEFMADAEAFFETLDLNHDGVLSSYEVAIYEHNVAPEILGYNVAVSDLRGGRRVPGHEGGQLWLAQIASPQVGLDQPNEATAQTETLPEGAAPFSLLETPEPLAAADAEFSGFITKANYMKVADRRFDTLDHDQDGFLVLAKLPKTYVQKKLAKPVRKGFHF